MTLITRFGTALVLLAAVLPFAAANGIPTGSASCNEQEFWQVNLLNYPGIFLKMCDSLQVPRQGLLPPLWRRSIASPTSGGQRLPSCGLLLARRSGMLRSKSTPPARLPSPAVQEGLGLVPWSPLVPASAFAATSPSQSLRPLPQRLEALAQISLSQPLPYRPRCVPHCKFDEWRL
jgi:hypothetical protein